MRHFALSLALLCAASAHASLVTFVKAPASATSPNNTPTAQNPPGVGAFNTRWPGFGAHRDQRLAGFAKTKATDAGAVVFLGDSITEGWNLAKAFAAMKTANRGISGDTSRGILGRLTDNVLDLKPKGVVLLCGINDINQVGGTPESVAANVKSIIEAIRAADRTTPILVPEVMPSNACAVELIHKTNALVDKVVANLPGVRRVRCFKALADAQGRPIAKLFPDGTHPNAAGYAVYQKLLEAELAKAGLLR